MSQNRYPNHASQPRTSHTDHNNNKGHSLIVFFIFCLFYVAFGIAGYSYSLLTVSCIIERKVPKRISMKLDNRNTCKMFQFKDKAILRYFNNFTHVD